MMEVGAAARWGLIILLCGIPTVIVVYALVRSASFAFFRSKYEHWRRVRRDLRGD